MNIAVIISIAARTVVIRQEKQSICKYMKNINLIILSIKIHRMLNFIGFFFCLTQDYYGRDRCYYNSCGFIDFKLYFTLPSIALPLKKDAAKK